LELGETIDGYKNRDNPLTYAEIGNLIGKSGAATRSIHRRWKKRLKSKPDEHEGYTWNENHNIADVTFTTENRITTLEQLLDAGKVDTSVWKVERWLINKWEVGTKDANRDVVIHPLFQVKAWLIKHNPVPILPVIKPIKCDYTYDFPIHKHTIGDIHTSLVWGDPHFGYERDMQGGYIKPYHNESVLTVILNLAKYLQPERMDIIGDMLDLAEWSDKYLRSPEMMETTQTALNSAHWWLREFRKALPDTEIYLYEGNHEHRMKKMLIAHLSVAYGLRPADKLDLPPAMSVPNLLGLDGLGIKWVDGYPDNAQWLNDGLQISHGDIVRSGPGDTTKALSKDSYHSQIIGHIHRVELVTSTHNLRGKQQYVTAFSPGCTCWCDNRVPGNSTRRQWQNGCGVVEYEVDGDAFTITPILVSNGKMVYNGKVFTA